jgi:hypothetical protein
MLHKAKIINGALKIKNKERWNDDLVKYNEKDVIITLDKDSKTRTLTQNKALHLYFTLLADELNLAGYDMKSVIKKEIDIPWSGSSVKEYLWRPIQKQQLQEKSTTRIKTTDIDLIYDTVNRIVGERTGVHVGFPNIDSLIDRIEEKN